MYSWSGLFFTCKLQWISPQKFQLKRAARDVSGQSVRTVPNHGLSQTMTVPKNVTNDKEWTVGKGLLLVISRKMVNAIQILSTTNTIETAGRDCSLIYDMFVFANLYLSVLPKANGLRIQHCHMNCIHQ